VSGIDDRDILRFWRHYRRHVPLRWPEWQARMIRLKGARYLDHNQPPRLISVPEGGFRDGEPPGEPVFPAGAARQSRRAGTRPPASGTDSRLHQKQGFERSGGV
jgi:hypothetical protein